MPSQPRDTGWDFGSVIHLIDSDVHDIRSPTLRPSENRPLISGLRDGGIHLGSFGKLYEDLGLSNISRADPLLDPESELSNSSDDALLPSPILGATKAVQAPPSPIEDIEKSENEITKTTKLSKKQRKKARTQAEKEREESAREKESQSEPEVPAETPSKTPRSFLRSSMGAKIRPASPVLATEAPAPKLKEPATPKLLRPILKKRSSTTQPVTPKAEKPTSIVPTTPTAETIQAPRASSPTPGYVGQTTLSTPGAVQALQLFIPAGHHGLVPRTVRPLTVPRSSQQPPSTPLPLMLPPPTPRPQVTNITIRSQVDRHFHFFNKLLHHFPDDGRWLVSPRQLVNESTTNHGLHVFVDASNIMYGFRDALRYCGLNQSYDISFDSLALLMERRRPVTKRVFAGSHREANPIPQVMKIIETSKAVGYESNVNEQVLIVREESEKKRFFNDVKKVGWHKAQQMRSGSGSDSETGMPTSKTPATPKWVEQGVDEILHLKMCQSIIDTEVPSLMVVATGDGAEAEMSDGFLAHVERALRKGWKVELVSWKQQLNGGYRNRKFRMKWADQFKIIELDDFLEDLIDTP